MVARMPIGPGQATSSGGATTPVTEAMTAAAVTPAGKGTEAPGGAIAETRHPGRPSAPLLTAEGTSRPVGVYNSCSFA